MPVIGKDSVEYIKEKVNQFLVSIKRAIPEEQHCLLKEYVESITANKVILKQHKSLGVKPKLLFLPYFGGGERSRTAVRNHIL
jgi:hypothetical protein